MNTMEYILNSHENELTTSTSKEMNKSQSYNDEWKRPDTKNTECMIPFIWNLKQIYVRRNNGYLCLGGTVTRCSGIANLFLDLGVCYIGLLKLEKIYQAVFLSGHISKYILYFNKKFTKNNSLTTFSFLIRLFLNLFSRMQVIS